MSVGGQLVDPPSPLLQLSQGSSLSNNTRIIMAKPDPYADIDFEEITDATGLAIDEIKCLKVGF